MLSREQSAEKRERRIYGCWLGKSIGGTLGIPAEGLPGPLAFEYYDPIPQSAPPNDDLELQLVWLHVLEQRGFGLTQQILASAWLEHIHYMWDEYGRCRWNLRRGVPPSAAGTFENWFDSGMGSPIRSEIWACLCAGEPEAAIRYAALDASLDHGPEGIAGEVFNASLQSRILGGAGLKASLDAAFADIDPGSAVAHAIRLVREAYERRVPAWDAYATLVAAHRQDNFTYAPLNLGLTAWALYYGEGDFTRSLLLATNCGYDTDCTAATVGATLGMLLGPDAIEARWKEPIGEGIHCGPGILGIRAAGSLGELTTRICRLQAQRESTGATPPEWPPATPEVDVSRLPGTILVQPLDGSPSIPWSNGPVPSAIRAAGGAEWTWAVGPDTRDGAVLSLLARQGARLLVDGHPFIECAAGTPFVPRVHLLPEGTFRALKPEQTQLRIRLELACTRPDQEVSVILAEPSLHLTPWNGEALPHRARLPIRPVKVLPPTP